MQKRRYPLSAAIVLDLAMQFGADAQGRRSGKIQPAHLAGDNGVQASNQDLMCP